MRPAPFRRACRIFAAITGWASEGLAPMTKSIVLSAISPMEFVMAPEPKAVTRPATVGLCQVRAQWSTLFVPITARMNFCSR